MDASAVVTSDGPMPDDELVAAPTPSPEPARRVFGRDVFARGGLGPTSTAPTYIGLLLTAAGFGLIGYAWGRVASLTSVALQLPYLASAGFSGLGLVVVGIAVIAVQARRQDAAARQRQVELLADLVAELRDDQTGRPAQTNRGGSGS